MNLIQASVQTFLPPKRKLTPSGWLSFNAACCHHNGHTKDTRKRGGVVFNEDGFQYHCFNCGFKAGWTPGKLLSKNTKSLFRWLGMPDDEISRLNIEALKTKEDSPKTKPIITFDLQEKLLPEDSKSIIEWANLECNDEDFLRVIEYISDRGMEIDWYPWHWSPANGYRDRVLIPFYQDGKVVGWTGRKITPGKPKYLTDAQPGYLFNIDRQSLDKKYVIVVEGQFDAIAIDGCGVMSNEMSATQMMRLNALQKEVIVVPDRDKAGAGLISAALENNWAVSLPEWEENIKDVADAVKNYGRIYTLFTILSYKETNEIKIQLLKKKLENIND